MTSELSPTLFKSTKKSRKGGSVSFERKTAQDLGLDEFWFRDSIAANPNLVISVCEREGIAFENEEWFHWSTEATVSGLRLDVLLVSSLGRVGIVETKLARNPGSRRAVLAQILEYAVKLRAASLADMPQRPSNLNVDDIHIEKHLADGDYLLIVAGDELDTHVIELGETVLADHILNPWTLAHIDIALYAGTNKSDSMLLVPHLRHAYVCDMRHIVKIEMSGISSEISIVKEQKPPARKGTREIDPRMQEVFRLFSPIMPSDFITGVKKPRTFQYYRPKGTDWPTHYEFLEYKENGNIGVEIHLEDEDSCRHEDYLVKQSKKIKVENAITDYDEARPGLRLMFGPDAAPTEIVDAMLLLVKKTRAQLWG